MSVFARMAVPRAAQSCSNCDAFLANGAANPKSGEARQGWCRAMAPCLVQVMVPSINGPRPGTQGAWPTCNSDQWCRQWEPDDSEASRDNQHHGHERS